MPAIHTFEIVAAFPPRMRGVLDLLLLGRSEKEVANELGISSHTVHAHVKQLYRALDVNSRAELLVLLLSRQETKTPLQATGVDDAARRTFVPSPSVPDAQTTA